MGDSLHGQGEGRLDPNVRKACGKLQWQAGHIVAPPRNALALVPIHESLSFPECLKTRQSQ